MEIKSILEHQMVLTKWHYDSLSESEMLRYNFS